MHHKKHLIAVSIISVLLFVLISQVYAATAPTLGMVGSFAVLSAQSISNTGATVITGDVGISPGNESSVTGFFPPGTYSGELHAANAVSLQAQNDATTVYNALNSQLCDTDLTGQDLGTLGPLVAGVYCFDTSAQLTGNLVLDAGGDPNSVWIFRMGSTLTTASASSVTYINSEEPLCNVFWQVGSSATLGTTTEFIGNIFAVTSVTLNTDANLEGRAIARTGSVTLDDNNIGSDTCITDSVPAPTPTATTGPGNGGSSTPEVPGLPATGSGAFIFNEMSPWSLVFFGGIFATAVIISVRSSRKTDRPKK
jgi:hypothetical protein